MGFRRDFWRFFSRNERSVRDLVDNIKQKQGGMHYTRRIVSIAEILSPSYEEMLQHLGNVNRLYQLMMDCGNHTPPGKYFDTETDGKSRFEIAGLLQRFTSVDDEMFQNPGICRRDRLHTLMTALFQASGQGGSFTLSELVKERIEPDEPVEPDCGKGNELGKVYVQPIKVTRTASNGYIPRPLCYCLYGRIVQSKLD